MDTALADPAMRDPVARGGGGAAAGVPGRQGGEGWRLETCRIYLNSFGMDSVFLTDESILDPGYDIWE